MIRVDMAAQSWIFPILSFLQSCEPKRSRPSETLQLTFPCRFLNPSFPPLVVTTLRLVELRNNFELESSLEILGRQEKKGIHIVIVCFFQ